MHPSISTSYILPAIFLNPVLFLHGLNSILSRLLPPIIIPSATVQRPAYSMLGPAATYQHIDIQNSENLCLGYTFVMICAQLVAYGRVMKVREAGKERQQKKDEMNGKNRHAKHSESYFDEGNSKPPSPRRVGFTNGSVKKFRKHEEPDCLTEEESEVIL